MDKDSLLTASTPSNLPELMGLTHRMLVMSEALEQGIQVGLTGPPADVLAWTIRIPDGVTAPPPV